MARIFTVSTPRNSLDFPDSLSAFAAVARIRSEDARWPFSRPTRVTLTSTPVVGPDPFDVDPFDNRWSD